MGGLTRGRLTVIDGPDEGKHVIFSERARVGRDASLELEISDADTGVHRRPHFVVYNRNGEFHLVSDYENDTRVHGQVVQNARLRSGDLIQIGFRTTIRFDDEETRQSRLPDSIDPPTDANI